MILFQTESSPPLGATPHYHFITHRVERQVKEDPALQDRHPARMVWWLVVSGLSEA